MQGVGCWKGSVQGAWTAECKVQGGQCAGYRVDKVQGTERAVCREDSVQGAWRAVFKVQDWWYTGRMEGSEQGVGRVVSRVRGEVCGGAACRVPPALPRYAKSVLQVAGDGWLLHTRPDTKGEGMLPN